MGFLLSFTDKFVVALGLWPVASLMLTLPILALLYHRDGRLRAWSAVGAYLTVLYLLGLVCFTLYPLPSGTSGPGISYGIPPQLNPFQFVADIRKDGMPAVLQVVMNVVLFLPFGFIVGRLFGKGFGFTCALGFATSLLIETAQLTGIFGMYPYAFRTFDVDDLMCNTVGAMTGWWSAWALGRLLPEPERHAIAPTTTPGLVRRTVAWCLDMTLALTVTVALSAVLLLAIAWAGHGTSYDTASVVLVGAAVFLAIEGVIPWVRGGSTPGGSFVRMTCETRERTGARRVVFYAVRLVVLGAATLWLPLAAPLILLFWLFARRMPYDFI